MEVISSTDTWHIIKQTLNYVDTRLMEHGSRVAYLTCQVMRCAGNCSADMLNHIAVMALLHDIGAYKTEEIDRMVEFETTTVWEHSIYGYLFLKNLSPLQESAAAVLYHHLDYQDFGAVSLPAPVKETAQLIFLCDRVDILLKNGGTLPAIAAHLRENAGTRFSPRLVSLFLAADRERGLLESLKTGAYRAEMEPFVAGLRFTPEERRDFLRMVAYSIDFRSAFMVLHTVTTVCVSGEIARLLGMTEEEREKVYYGALLHDIGKVAIPIAILEKPGRLCDEEMAVMRSHVAVSGDILRGYLNQEVYRIAVRHHEKMDGSGYPEGLCGDALTTAERIVVVSDIISALIRKRSYKEAFSREKTRQILAQMRDDGQLWPDLTDLVLTHFDSLLDASISSGREVQELYLDFKREYRMTVEAVSAPL